MSAETHFICNHITANYSSKYLKDYVRFRFYKQNESINKDPRILEELLHVSKQYLDYLKYFTISCTCIPLFHESIQVLETHLKNINYKI